MPSRAPSKKAAWLFGSVLLLVLCAIFVWMGRDEDLSSSRCVILRLFISLTGGLFATFFAGKVAAKGSVMGMPIAAAGGAAIFVLLQFGPSPLPCGPGTASAPPPNSASSEILITFPSDGAMVGHVSQVEWT